jgi:hypothetical protein
VTFRFVKCNGRPRGIDEIDTAVERAKASAAPFTISVSCTLKPRFAKHYADDVAKAIWPGSMPAELSPNPGDGPGRAAA